MGRVVSPTPTPLSSGRVVPALVASYDMHGRAVGLFYTQPTGQLTRLDYCNSLLAGLHDNKLNKLQRTQNHAARIVPRKPRHVSATSLLRALHWLPVKARIQYKIACLCFQCLSHNTMPPYLSDLLHPYQPPRTLRSLDTSLLSVPHFCLETFGRRFFSVFGPTVWNSLPLSLRNKTQCFSLFKRS